ncbi:MAG: cation:proton antiporter [Elusimicrobiales bacterium]
MHAGFLLKDLAVIMTVAAVVMYVCHRLRQPAVIGYLLAGLIIGPHTPPFSFVSDIASIRSISELGLVFLMFSLGLEFNLPRLRQAGLRAAVSALIVVSGMLLTGLAAGRMLGWGIPGGLLLGAVLSISGSTVIAKVFFDAGLSRQPFARAVFGLMIFDDIAAMVMLSLISGAGAAAASGLAAGAALAFMRITFFILLFLTLGLLLVPKALEAVTARRSRELTGISALGLCFAGAYIAASFNFSVALGTFLMGAIVSASPGRDDIESWTAPLRDMFSALFFVSAGMLADPRGVAANWPAALLMLFLAVAARSLWGAAASALAGYELRASVRIGISSAQIGEFSFILAAAGIAGGLAPEWLYGVTVATAVLTAFIFPYLMRAMPETEELVSSHFPAPLAALLERYHKLFWQPASDAEPERQPAIFSKYALRLAVYVTLAAGALYAGGEASSLAVSAWPARSEMLIPAIWLCAAAALAPAFAAIARYASHITLLLVTMSVSTLSRNLIRRLNVRLAYAVADACCLALLSGAFFAYIHRWFHPGGIFAAGAAALAASALLARRHILLAMEFSERLLDNIIGLASSEPFHRIIASGDGLPLLRSRTARWLIDENSPFAGRSIQELDIRAKTGATVIAIYRDGANFSNPGPHARLAPGDIVILFGNEEQCGKADSFFQQSGTACSA